MKYCTGTSMEKDPLKDTSNICIVSKKHMETDTLSKCMGKKCISEGIISKDGNVDSNIATEDKIDKKIEVSGNLLLKREEKEGAENRTPVPSVPESPGCEHVEVFLLSNSDCGPICEEGAQPASKVGINESDMRDISNEDEASKMEEDVTTYNLKECHVSGKIQNNDTICNLQKRVQEQYSTPTLKEVESIGESNEKYIKRSIYQREKKMAHLSNNDVTEIGREAERGREAKENVSVDKDLDDLLNGLEGRLATDNKESYNISESFQNNETTCNLQNHNQGHSSTHTLVKEESTAELHETHNSSLYQRDNDIPYQSDSDLTDTTCEDVDDNDLLGISGEEDGDVKENVIVGYKNLRDMPNDLEGGVARDMSSDSKECHNTSVSIKKNVVICNLEEEKQEQYSTHTLVKEKSTAQSDEKNIKSLLYQRDNNAPDVNSSACIVIDISSEDEECGETKEDILVNSNDLRDIPNDLEGGVAIGDISADSKDHRNTSESIQKNDTICNLQENMQEQNSIHTLVKEESSAESDVPDINSGAWIVIDITDEDEESGEAKEDISVSSSNYFRDIPNDLEGGVANGDVSPDSNKCCESGSNKSNESMCNLQKKLQEQYSTLTLVKEECTLQNNETYKKDNVLDHNKEIIKEGKVSISAPVGTVKGESVKDADEVVIIEERKISMSAPVEIAKQQGGNDANTSKKLLNLPPLGAQENADNNNPEWQVLRKLETDVERYKAVRRRWRNLHIPDPNKNLTYIHLKNKENRPYFPVSFNDRQSRKRTCSEAGISDTDKPAVKHARTQSCTLPFDLKVKELMKTKAEKEKQLLLEKHQTFIWCGQEWNRLLRSNLRHCNYHEYMSQVAQLRFKESQVIARAATNYSSAMNALQAENRSKRNILVKAMKEVKNFHQFYQKLDASPESRNCTYLTDEEIGDIFEEDKLYEKFKTFYQ